MNLQTKKYAMVGDTLRITTKLYVLCINDYIKFMQIVKSLFVIKCQRM